MVGQAAQVIELGVAIGLFQGAGVQFKAVFAAVFANGLVCAGSFLRKASVQAAQVAEAQYPFIDGGLVVIAQPGGFDHLRLEAFYQCPAVETVPLGNQRDAILALKAFATTIVADAHDGVRCTLQSGDGVDFAQLQFVEQQGCHGAVVADGAQQLKRLFRVFCVLLWLARATLGLFDSAQQHLPVGGGQR
ncbi:hypothetical protein D3C79_715830 [compost metagenome]